jgi:hypothetical protein
MNEQGDVMADSNQRCPSEDPNARAVPGDYLCPACGTAVEIWSDEAQTTCACGAVVVRAAAEPA